MITFVFIASDKNDVIIIHVCFIICVQHIVHEDVK